MAKTVTTTRTFIPLFIGILTATVCLYLGFPYIAIEGVSLYRVSLAVCLMGAVGRTARLNAIHPKKSSYRKLEILREDFNEKNVAQI